MNEKNETGKYDTARPFVAIVPDEVEGTVFHPTYGVYLVNPLDKPLCNVYEGVGGFFSAEEVGVIEASPKREGPFDVAPHSAYRLEMTSYDEFAELDCWWTVSYEIDGVRHKGKFDAGKALRDTEAIDNCPILNRYALIVSR